MNQYKVYRVETDVGSVASVVVACCKEGKAFYAEYIVLYEFPDGSCRHWYCFEQTTEEQAEHILNNAWQNAKQRVTSEELVGLFNEKHRNGDSSDFDGYFKRKYLDEMLKICAKVKCQCLKDLLTGC